MKFPSASISLALLSASTALAAGTLEFSLGREQHLQAPDIIERDVKNTSESALYTNYVGSLGIRYYLNLTVGTPPQPQTVFVDTGSSNLIIFADDASFCGKNSQHCPGDTYNASASSTYKMLSPGAINIFYGANSTATSGDGNFVADLVADTVQVGDIAVSGAHIGVAHQGSGNFLGNGDYVGLLGLGYPASEAVNPGAPEYPTFVQSLVGAGAIASRLFSLYLNEVSSYGSLLFGGLDTEKYTGNLTTLDFFYNKFPSGERSVINFYMSVDQVSMTHEDGSQEMVIQHYEQTQPVIPDSGTATWNVPADIYSRIVNMTGVTESGGAQVLPCSKVSNKTSFTFTFSGNGNNTARLEVPLSTLFVPAARSDGKGVFKADGEDLCALMVEPTDPSVPVLLLGDAIMRAGYWIFDLDNGQVSIAQANLSSTMSNIVAVEAGPHGVMKAAKQPSELSAVQTVSVNGSATASVSPSFTTATNTVGQTSGPQSTVLGSGAAGHMADVTFGAALASALMLSVTFAAFML